MGESLRVSSSSLRFPRGLKLQLAGRQKEADLQKVRCIFFEGFASKDGLSQDVDEAQASEASSSPTSVTDMPQESRGTSIGMIK